MLRISTNLFQLPSRSRWRVPDLVVGEGEDGRPCALLKARMLRATQGELELTGEYLFNGIVPSSRDAPLFYAATFALDGLESWLDRNPLRVGEGALDSQGGVLLYSEPKPSVDAQVGDARIELDDRLSSMQSGKTTWTFGHRATFTVHYERAVSFRQVFEDAVSLQLFVSVLGGHVLLHHEVGLHLASQLREPSDLARVFYRSPYSWLAGEQDEWDLRFPQIADLYPGMLQSWWRRRDVLRAPVTLLLSTFGERPLEAEVRLLATIQAFEAYHRRSRGGTYMAEDSYRTDVELPLTRAIPGDLPDALKSSLKARIRFGNEHSLRTRLCSLLGELDERVSSNVMRNAKDFVNVAVNTRNSTHVLPDSLGLRLWRGDELLYGAERLRRLLLALLLQDLGVSKSRTWDLLFAEHTFRYLEERGVDR